MASQMSTEKLIYKVEFTIIGEPASKANSRRLVRFGTRVASIKSAKALNYVDSFTRQCPTLPRLMEGALSVHLTIYYASGRPDLDESVILDAMQGLIYQNDRQVKEKHVLWGRDPEAPRAHIRVECIEYPVQRDAVEEGRLASAERRRLRTRKVKV